MLDATLKSFGRFGLYDGESGEEAVEGERTEEHAAWSGNGRDRGTTTP
jgi:hypothetical protein